MGTDPITKNVNSSYLDSAIKIMNIMGYNKSNVKRVFLEGSVYFT
jgi:hypothetical protein